MNLKKLMIVCGLAAVGLASMVSAALAEPMRVTQNSDLHAGPGTGTLVVGTVAANTTVDRQQCTTNGQWCYVTRQTGQPGWIQSARLADPVGSSPGGPGVAAYANAQVNVRSGPGTQFEPPVGRLEQYDEVRRFQCENNWCYITRQGGTPGWVSSRYLTVGAAPPVDAPGTPTPPPPSAETVVVVANVNLRSSPASGNNVIGQVPRGTVVTVQNCTVARDWCSVRLPNGNTGWVSAQYLSASLPDEPTPPPPPPPAAGTDLYQARVLLNVRQSPNGNVIGVLQPGQVVVRERCTPAGDWCFIRTEIGNTGWVSASFIEPARAGTPTPPPPPPPSGGSGQVCFQGPLGSICIGA